MMRFNIPGMTCGGCARSIIAVIQAMDGKARVEADLSAKHVGVESRVGRDALVAAIREAGYEAYPA
ncbi:heavy-metal-associated domain-containing protein [Sphingomonas colocasiae]|uniref:Heavy-metal-associated domain-containing protein n=1 Tax=Sphingomonas colocasiae TaxID=1848973 RepID=A0ABS7PHE1_9SPHN|nr:heavy-metal-associated domain-containing protein [Sphingomonas colocasiae]MBY8820722.1 heavy-metal-associated domain-containing protein [Sphingomonas colocasiae]